MLHGELYRLRIPVILGFEGWDAAGKGGAIKRLTSHLDPRGYTGLPDSIPERCGKIPSLSLALLESCSEGRTHRDL
ncbi:MAG: hypothetical protein ACLUAR_16435 [Pilosibacter sp.]